MTFFAGAANQVSKIKASQVLGGLVVLGSLAGAGYLLLKKNPSEAEFELSKPLVTPSIADIGEEVTITCPIKNVSTVKQVVEVKMEIFHAGFLWTAGELVETKTKTITIEAGVTGKATFVHTAALGGPINSSGVAMRAIGITTSMAGKVVGKPWESDDAFGVQVNQAAKQLEVTSQKTISTATPTAGQDVIFTVYIMNHGAAVNGQIHFVVRDAVLLVSVDILNDVWSPPTAFPAGATTPVSFTHKAKLTAQTSRNIEVESDIITSAGARNKSDSNKFANVYSVPKVSDLLKLTSTYTVTSTTPKVGDVMTFTTTVTNTSNAPIQGVIKFETHLAALVGDGPIVGAPFVTLLTTFPIGDTVVSYQSTVALGTASSRDIFVSSFVSVAGEQTLTDSNVFRDIYAVQTAQPQFRDIQLVSVAPNMVRTGDVLTFSGNLEYSGPATELDLFVAIGVKGITFAELAYVRGKISMPEKLNWTRVAWTMTLQVPANINPADSPYDAYAKIEATIPLVSNILLHVVTLISSALSVVSVSASPSSVNYTNTPIYVSIVLNNTGNTGVDFNVKVEIFEHRDLGTGLLNSTQMMDVEYLSQGAMGTFVMVAYAGGTWGLKDMIITVYDALVGNRVLATFRENNVFQVIAPTPEGQYQLTVVADPLIGGVATKYPVKTLYNDGEQVWISATPTIGYKVDYWDLDGEWFDGATEGFYYLAYGDHTLTCHFIVDDPNPYG
jgi:hypothetical protein